METIPYIILGDIHGREFWKEILDSDRVDSNTQVVFVGDYYDPYTSIEGIRNADALSNFKDIIMYARLNSNVTLLLGNHDCGYVYGMDYCMSRHDFTGHNEIKKLFNDNADLFSFVYDFEVGDKYFVVSHAGIRAEWAVKHKYIGDDLNSDIKYSDLFNPMLKDDDMKRLSLIEVSAERGGYDRVGSLIWSDVHEVPGTRQIKYKGKDVHQIFGHTALFHRVEGVSGWVLDTAMRVDDTNVCIDCGTPIYVDKDGEIRYFKNDIAI